MPRSIISASGGIHHEKLDTTGSGPAEAMGSLKGCPAAPCWPCHLLLRPPPEGARHSCLELDIHALDPSLRSSKVWPVTLGWHQMVKGSWPSRSSTRILSKCAFEINLSPCQSRPRRPVMTPTPVVSSNVLFWTVVVPSWDSGPMLRNATDALFHVLHPAAITLTAAHTRPPSPRPSAATCEHEQLSVMARQPPLLHTLALKSYPKRRSLSA